MTLKPAPRAATWFLNRFGSDTDDDSVLGDLAEQYQRGRGSLWYWRQVLSIVYMGLFQEFRRDKRRFIGAFVSTWCVWGVLQFTACIFLGVCYVLLHPAELPFGIQVSGFPVLDLQSGAESKYAAQWAFILFTLALNVLPLLLVGRLCARSSRIHPRYLMLAFITSFVVCDAGWMATNLLMIARHLPTEVGFIIIIRDLAALPMTAALILLGGRKGLSPASQLVRG